MAIELTPAEETSLDDLIRMLMENHECTERDALLAIRNKITLPENE